MWRWLIKQTAEILSEIRSGEIMAVVTTIYAVLFVGAAFYVAVNFGTLWGFLVLPLSIIPILILTVITKLALSSFTRELNWFTGGVEENQKHLELFVDDKTVSQGNEHASIDLYFMLNVVNEGNRKITELDAHLYRIDQITEKIPDDRVNDISTSYMKRLEWEDESYVVELKPGFSEMKRLRIAMVDCYSQEHKFIHEGKPRSPRIFTEDAIYRIYVEFKGILEGTDSIYRRFYYQTVFVCSPQLCILDTAQEALKNPGLPNFLGYRLTNKTFAVNVHVKKYSFPDINSKVVGVTIIPKNDLTDISLKLIELKKSQFNASSSESAVSISIRLDKRNCNFDLERDSTIKAEDEKVFGLGEFKGDRFYFLVKEPFDPEHLFQEQNSGINMPNAEWELKFELRGKMRENDYKEVFYTRIGVIGKIVHIGEIIHVKDQRST